MGAELGDDQDKAGGAERVRQHREDVPGGGRTIGQTVILVIGAIVVLAALLWFLVPFGG